MKRFFFQVPRAAIVAIAMMMASYAIAQPPIFLRDYHFVPLRSTAHVSGGSQNYNMNLSILGRFDWATGLDEVIGPNQVPMLVPIGEFADVHAILFNPLSAAPVPVPGWDLDKTLNLTGLESNYDKASNDFILTGVDGQGIPIRLEAALRGPLFHLTGMNFLPPTCFTCQQYIGYKVDALAVTRPYADFNLDGVVDAADFAIWRANSGAGGTATFEQGDANGDGVVDSADYVVWRHTLGPATSLNVFAESGGLGTSTVPEPTAIGLAFTAALFVGAYLARSKA